MDHAFGVRHALRIEICPLCSYKVEILPLATNEICELSVDERCGVTLEFKSLIF